MDPKDTANETDDLEVLRGRIAALELWTRAVIEALPRDVADRMRLPFNEARVKREAKAALTNGEIGFLGTDDVLQAARSKALRGA